MSRKKRDAERREEKKRNDPFSFRVNEMAHGVLARTRYKLHTEKNRSYRERGIECRIGTNMAEVRQTLIEHFTDDIRGIMEQGEIPTVDRLDSYGHYEIGNIQILPLEENRRKQVSPAARAVIVTKPDGRVKRFDSVSAASRALAIKRDTIYANAERGTRSRSGYLFEIEEEAE